MQSTRKRTNVQSHGALKTYGAIYCTDLIPYSASRLRWWHMHPACNRIKSKIKDTETLFPDVTHDIVLHHTAASSRKTGMQEFMHPKKGVHV